MAKTLLAALALVALSLGALAIEPTPAAAADEFTWLDALDDGLAEAKATGKPILLEVR